MADSAAIHNAPGALLVATAVIAKETGQANAMRRNLIKDEALARAALQRGAQQPDIAFGDNGIQSRRPL